MQIVSRPYKADWIGRHDPYRRDVLAQPEMKTKAMHIQMNLT
jgi:hypothetical protein